MANPVTAMLIRPVMRRRNTKKMIITGQNGVNEQKYVDINGIQQWITIRGQDRANPILFVVHGGPGSSYIPFAPWLTEWERYVTIVQWDQRGCGKTYQKNRETSIGELTLDQLARDGIAVIEYVRTHLQQPKVVLLGSSVGSLIGTIIAQMRPDLLWAYVGTEQNTSDMHASTYTLTKAAAAKNNDKKGLTRLMAMGNDPVNWTYEDVLAMDKIAIKNSKDVPNMIFDLMLPALLFSPDYTMRDIQDSEKSMGFVGRALFEDTKSFKLESLGNNFAMPFFIFQGEGDIITPVATARRYFDTIQAPHKEFVTIPRAGHLAAFCNPKQFLHELRSRVLPVTDSNRIMTRNLNKYNQTDKD